MTVSSFGATGIPVAYSQPLRQPLSQPLQPIAPPSFAASSARGEVDVSSTNKISSTFAPSEKEAEYGKRFVIAPEEGATRANRTGNNTAQNSPEQTEPQQIGRQIGLFVDRVV